MAGEIIHDSGECCRRVRAEFGPVALLAFSRGKDSIAAWLRLREHFEDVQAIWFYLIPGLEFEAESIAYFERFFGTRIRRLPHPSLNRMLNALVFQPPGHCAVIEAAQLPEYEYVDCFAELARDLALPDEIPYATGVRAVDSPLRRISYNQHGLWRRSMRMWLPVGDWRKRDVMSAIERAGIKLPLDYELFGRSFDGLDYRFLSKLRERLPRDYARVLEWFPLAEADVFRYERMGFRP
jgi:3'-phosphoadenosine 5'-phosphosulfate sulfotransferase (PAPS reductase)/FAD synthetase